MEGAVGQNQQVFSTNTVTFYWKNKRIILSKTFFELWFNYCQPIWMFFNKIINKKIDRLRCGLSIRIMYSTFMNSCKKDKSFTIHKRNFRALVIEMYKMAKTKALKFIARRNETPYVPWGFQRKSQKYDFGSMSLQFL